jgi:hypothetical protein
VSDHLSSLSSARNLANVLSAPGRAAIGNSTPAKNQGRIAITGVAAMYSSCWWMRLASVSAAPYIDFAERELTG